MIEIEEISKEQTLPHATFRAVLGQGDIDLLVKYPIGVGDLEVGLALRAVLHKMTNTMD